MKVTNKTLSITSVVIVWIGLVVLGVTLTLMGQKAVANIKQEGKSEYIASNCNITRYADGSTAGYLCKEKE